MESPSRHMAGAGERAAIRPSLRARRDLHIRRVYRRAVSKAARLVCLCAADAIAAGTAWIMAQAVLTGGYSGVKGHLGIVLSLGILGQAALGTYGSTRFRRQAGRILLGAAVALAMLAIVTSATPALEITTSGLAIFAVAFTGLLLMGRVGVALCVRALHRAGIGLTRTLLIGTQFDEAWLARSLYARRNEQVKLVGRLYLDREEGTAALGGVDRLTDVLEELEVDRVVVLTMLPYDVADQVTRESLLHGAELSFVPAQLRDLAVCGESNDVLGWPLLTLDAGAKHVLQLIVKRVIDVVCVAAGLLALIPVLAVIAIAVKIDSPGPVLFRQKRLGVGGRLFTMYKFRSMRPDAEAVLAADPVLYRKWVENDYKLPAEEDPRISRVGRFLRRTSLDELPQLFNVLIGDMSLVGPRPIVPVELKEYGAHQKTFLSVKPGLTGYWQISGRSTVGYPERAEIDIEYILNWSLGLDLKILIATPISVIRGVGAH